MPTLPPVFGTQNALIHTGSGAKPTLNDLGLAGKFLGGVITNSKSAFPNTHDTLFNEFMQPAADIIYGFGFEFTFDFEVHDRTKAASGSPLSDPGVPTMQIGTLIDADTVQILTVGDARGFATGSGTAPGTLWDNNTKFIVQDGAGAFERQKVRKDSIKLIFRIY